MRLRSHLVILILIMCSASALSAQDSTAQTLLKPPVADKRVELLSIVFRLAGAEEYMNESFKMYTDAIHRHFDPYSNHPVVQMAKQLRAKNGIGFDAVMFLAVHLSQPPELKPLVPFNDRIPEKRWGKKNAEAFTAELRRFYQDADCSSFFDSTAQLYEKAAAAARETFSKLDAGWYNKYYGIQASGQFNVVLGLGNGGGNYGPKVVYPGGAASMYAIMGTWQTDFSGYAKYDPGNYLPTFIHEFNHSFINTTTTAFHKQLQASARKVNDAVAAEMKAQAYGNWETLINESLVRAAVIRYLVKHHATETEIRREIALQRSRGWYWISELSALLEVYEQHRDRYPSFSQFMPRVVAFYDSLAPVAAAMKEKFTATCPVVRSTEPAINGAEDVSPGLLTLKISFNKPLSGKGYSFGWGKDGAAHNPALTFKSYTDQNTAILVELNLNAGKDYAFTLTGLGFVTPDAYPLQTYEVRFRTKN